MSDAKGRIEFENGSEKFINYDWEDDAKKCYALAVDVIRVTKCGYRCPFCGNPSGREEQENGHYKMTCCNQVIEGCCGGS